ncbi:MAG: XrtA system polysaccharide deacetylase [Planctomycetota bacterium]
MTAEKQINGISFDVEEYFHALNFRQAVHGLNRTPDSRVERGVHAILEILVRSSTRATFFILGKVAKEHPGLIRSIADQGHEIASHGDSHKTAMELGPDRFRNEAEASRKRLEDITGKQVAGFRASTFSITRETLWALDVLHEEGYRYDSSIFPVHHDRYGIPSFPSRPVKVITRSRSELIEFPPLTLAMPGANLPCGGGGYFRLFPLFITCWAVSRMNARNYPAVIYLHPWEFDPDQPHLPLGGLKTFRHYCNISRTGGRLESLLRRFSFDTLEALCTGSRNWDLFHLENLDS